MVSCSNFFVVALVLTACLLTAPICAFLPRQITTSKSSRRGLSLAAEATKVNKVPSSRHVVDGVNCVEVKIDLPLVQEITILEATADSQEVLVNLALEPDDFELLSSNTESVETSTLSLAHADPYGAVLWPAASAVARIMLEDRTKWLENQTILELGAGTGLVSLAAASGGATKVIATDYEEIPLRLLQYAQENLNPRHHQVAGMAPIETALLDLCRYEDAPLPEADVVVAADVMYEPKTGRALAHRVAEALARGSRVLIGDSPGRAGRPAFLKQLHALGFTEAAFVDVPGWTVTGDRNDLICGPTSTSVSDEPRAIMVAMMELDPKAREPTLQ